MLDRSRLLILLIAASGVIVLLYLVRGVLVPFALAAVVAYVSNPLVQAFESRQIPRSGAIVLVYVIFAVVGGLTLYVGVPLLAAEVEEMLANLPQARDLSDYTRGTAASVLHLRASHLLRTILSAGAQRVEVLLAQLVARSLEVILALLARTFTILLVPFLAFYFLRDTEKIQRWFLSLLPPARRQEVLVLAQRLNELMGAFLRGQLIVAAIVGLLISVGLASLKVKYALVIGTVAAVFEFIPYFGPVVAAVPAVLFAFVQSPATALWAVVLVVVVHQVEGAVLQPQVMSGSMDLHPLTVIFSILVGGELLGIWGMFLAVPAAASLKLIIGYLAEEVIGS
jgi:predicted PurR-regulated permease PerM